MAASRRFVQTVAFACAVGTATLARSAPPTDIVVLSGGDTLRCSVISCAEGFLEIDHPELGRMRLPLEKVASFGPMPATPAPASAQQPPAAPAPSAPPAAGLELTAPGSASEKVEARLPGPVHAALPGQRRLSGEWNVHLAFALAGNFAVNDEFTMRAGVGATRETERTKTTLDGEYYYRIFEDTTTDNNILVKALQEWKLGETPWLFFAQGQYQYDEFEPWTHRVSTYFGPGYRLYDTEEITLTLRLGAGATYEAGEVHRWEPELLFAEDFRWRISPRQQLMLNASIAPNVEDVADYRVQSNLEYQLLIDDAKRGLSLTAGLRDIFLSQPAPDAKANELRVYAGLRYDF